jgi:exodeoxyribonuclease VII small subunit
MAKNQSFEDALNKLEGIVEKFESGELSLDEMIKLYEEGSNLAKFCLAQLEKAENKIKILNAEDVIDKSSDLDSPDQ